MEITNIENTIIQSLLYNHEYFGKVFTHLKESHFQKIENLEIFKGIKGYYSDFQDAPKAKEIGLKLKDIKSENLKEATVEHFKGLVKDQKITNVDFMISETEKYVQYQEFKNAILKGAEAVQSGKELTDSYKLMGDALSISFDSVEGLNYSSDIDSRLEYYKSKMQGMSTGIPSLDDMLAGGYRKKTLNLIASVSHGGKSAVMASIVSNLTLSGYNGVLITLEMTEMECAKRIDCNILDIDINDFSNTANEVFEKKYNSIKDNLGRLIIKEYPASTMSTLRLESYLNDLYMEDGFKPDFVAVDYLTLMTSSTVTMSAGSYQYYAAVGKELHGFAKRNDVMLLSLVQINRSGYNNSEAGIENISESLAIAQVADSLAILTRSKEMDDVKQCRLTFVKNRNTGNLSSILLGVDFSKMRFYDIDVGSSFTNKPTTGFEMEDMFGMNNF